MIKICERRRPEGKPKPHTCSQIINHQRLYCFTGPVTPKGYYRTYSHSSWASRYPIPPIPPTATPFILLTFQPQRILPIKRIGWRHRCDHLGHEAPLPVITRIGRHRHRAVHTCRGLWLRCRLLRVHRVVDAVGGVQGATRVQRDVRATVEDKMRYIYAIQLIEYE